VAEDSLVAISGSTRQESSTRTEPTASKTRNGRPRRESSELSHAIQHYATLAATLTTSDDRKLNRRAQVIFIGLNLQGTDLLRPRMVVRHPLPFRAEFRLHTATDTVSACNIAPYRGATWYRVEPTGAWWPVAPIEALTGAEYRLISAGHLAYTDADISALIEEASQDGNLWRTIVERGFNELRERWPNAPEKLALAVQRGVYRDSLQPAIRRIQRHQKAA
jgi:hypothetical protein